MASFSFGQRETATYLLEVEDVIRIQVFNQPQILADVPVGRDGFVSVPFIGSVKAEGRTVDELSAELTKLYVQKLRLRDPIVSVTITQFRQYRATISGQVNRPQTIQFRQGDTIMSLLAQGGGPIRDIADLRRAYLRRGLSREAIPIDLYSMTIYGDMSQNYILRDGDELTVPEARINQILVTGAVQQPGPYPYREPMTLADAIADARGEIRYRSRFSKTVIIRPKPGLPGEYYTIQANFVKFVRQGDSTQNVLLQPGDFIFVPESNSPDIQQISSLINVAYIINQFGGALFGLKLLG